MPENEVLNDMLVDDKFEVELSNFVWNATDFAKDVGRSQVYVWEFLLRVYQAGACEGFQDGYRAALEA